MHLHAGIFYQRELIMSEGKPESPVCCESRPETEGEYRVGVSFNPGGNADVDLIKRLAASLIDAVGAAGKDHRCTAIAQTAIEEGAMWAVKSVTKPERR
ncbi:hypothetical protein V5J34_004925 [Endozoicomonas sp. NE35]